MASSPEQGYTGSERKSPETRQSNFELESIVPPGRQSEKQRANVRKAAPKIRHTTLAEEGFFEDAGGGKSSTSTQDGSRGRDLPNPGPHSQQSTSSSMHRLGSSTSPNPSPRRSRALPSQSKDALHTRAGTPSASKNPRQHTASHGHGSETSGRATPTSPVQREECPVSEIVKQPETRPISQDQLVAEVKGIYAGLVMVESKCIEVDNAQHAQDNPQKLNNEQWQALIALHRTLLHEHHDFFLASQHPSASLALQRLAAKYTMPARMWRHAIHSFLELLRHRLPASLEHMLTFIYLSYSMIALLLETVPTFKDTWIECLGDLGRYRMAIEEDNVHDREIWSGVSRHWYSQASDRAPTTGRLYHHLAILARPNPLQQLFYYAKSLCVPIPFLSARESIMTLFDPVLNDANNRLQLVDASFVKAHAIIFSQRESEKLDHALETFFGQLDSHIGRTTRRWVSAGICIALSNHCALFEYGDERSGLSRALNPRRQDDNIDHGMDGGKGLAQSRLSFIQARDLTFGTHNVVFRRYADPNTYAYLHVVLVFMFHLAQSPDAMDLVERPFPWKLLARVLNTLVSSSESIRFEAPEFPGSAATQETPRPLPEDYSMRGFLWAEDYFPNKWFPDDDKIDDEEKYLEVASMTEERKARCLWLAVRIAKIGKWLQYDDGSHVFSVPEEFEVDIDDLVPAGDDELMVDVDAAPVEATPQASTNWENDDVMEDRVPTLFS